MDVLIVVDMQVTMGSNPPKHDLQGVIVRINQLAAMVRARSGRIVWIHHCGAPDSDFDPHKPGWSLLPEFDHKQTDIVVRKTLNDPFAGTDLKATLDEVKPSRVLVTGWATDFCVDATVRSAVSNNYDVVAVSDGHTLSDRPHLDALQIIRHHNWVWSELITNRSVRVASTAELLAENAQRHSRLAPLPAIEYR
jgi:nicotinamidase-related amidase